MHEQEYHKIILSCSVITKVEKPDFPKVAAFLSRTGHRDVFVKACLK